MGKKRNQYTKEYKVEAVRLMVEEDRPVSELSRELGTAQSLLHRWKKKSEEGKVDPFPGQGRLSPENEELRQCPRFSLVFISLTKILNKQIFKVDLTNYLLSSIPVLFEKFLANGTI